MTTDQPPRPDAAEQRQRRRAIARRRDRRRLLLQRGAAAGLLLLAAVTLAALVSGGSDGGPARAPVSVAAHRAAATSAQPHRARVARPHRAAQATPLTRAVAWAVHQARRHMHEIGTTNCSPAIARWERHMGLPVPDAPPCRPWCGAFVHEAFYRAGIHLSARLIDPNESYTDAVSHQHGLRAIPKSSVRPGDILFFELDPGVQASHEAIVVGRPHDGRVRTAEGNVGHHAVLTRRGLRYAVLAARVTRSAASS